MRQLILLLLLSVCLLWAESSQAATFWDDELESGNSGYNIAGMLAQAPCAGVTSFSMDTANKVSGTASLKEGFPQGTLANPQLCGGFYDRAVDTADLWVRWYMRLSPGWQTGQYSKILALYGSVSGRSPGGWLEMTNGSTAVLWAAEHYPVAGAATIFSPTGDMNARTGPEGGFVCFEAHLKTNTVDVANGVLQLYKNGTLALNRNDMTWLKTSEGNQSSRFVTVRIYRQAGYGTRNLDRLAAGNTRVGCLGSIPPPVADTTAPSPPTAVTVN